MASSLKSIDAATAAKLMDQGALMVDVRESGEYARARIPGSQNIALSRFESSELRLGPDQAVVFFCASGNRTRVHAGRLAEKAGAKAINDRVPLLLRLCGDQGDLIRAKLRRADNEAEARRATSLLYHVASAVSLAWEGGRIHDIRGDALAGNAGQSAMLALRNVPAVPAE